MCNRKTSFLKDSLEPLSSDLQRISSGFYLFLFTQQTASEFLHQMCWQMVCAVWGLGGLWVEKMYRDLISLIISSLHLEHSVLCHWLAITPLLLLLPHPWLLVIFLFMSINTPTLLCSVCYCGQILTFMFTNIVGFCDKILIKSG